MDAKDLKMLGKLAFLEGARQDVLERLTKSAVKKHYAPGEVIIQEGSVGREVVVIMEGWVEVVKGSEEEEVKLASSGAGEVFGEMGFIEAQPRFATVRAVQPTCLMELSESALRAALAEQPELLYHTTELLSARLRDAQQAMIADLQVKNQELASAYHELNMAHEALVEKKRMEHELDLAHQLQQSILPRRFPRLPGVTIAARNRPARQVGGDFYDVIPLGNKRLGLVMADVSDKGMPAAIFMALTRSLIRAQARHSPSPARVLLSTHKLLMEMQVEEASAPHMFVTVFYGVLDMNTRTLCYARAGHDRPLLYNIRTGECTFLSSQGTLLGMLEDVHLEEVQVPFATGTTLLLYTDGITDANNPSGEFFGTERLLQAVCDASHLNAKDCCDQILSQVAEFQAEANQYDDIALMVVAA